MAVVASYVAELKVDDTKVDPGIASVRAKLANVGSGVSTANIDAFVTGIATELGKISAPAAAASASIASLGVQKAVLQGQIKSVEQSLRTEITAFLDAQKAVSAYGDESKKGNTIQQQLAGEIEKSRQKIAGLVQEQTNLKTSLGQVNTALKQTQNQTTETGLSFDKLKSGMQSVSQGALLGGAALVALGAGFAALIKSGSDLQQELVHVAGNTSMSAAEFANLQTQVVRLGLTTPIAMNEIGKSYMQAANFGFHFAEANLVVEAGLKSAVATGANAEQSIRALAVAMHIFQIPAAQAAETMDLLHLAAARGGQTLEQFVSVTGRVFSVAHAMGISLGDVTSALSALTSAGLSAAQAATGLQGLMVKIAVPAAGARDEIKRLSKATGVDLVSDFSAAGLASKGLSGVLDDVSKAVGNNTSEILKLIPAQRGGIAAIILTTTAVGDYKDRLKEAADVMSGKFKPTQQDAERAMQTLGAQATILGNSFQALGFEIVKAIGPSLTTGLTTLNSLLPTAVLFIGQLPPVILAATAAFFGAVGVVGTVSVALGGLVFILGGPVALAVVGLGIAIGGLAAIVALNFSRITSIISGSSGAIKINFISLAGGAGAVADAFQVLARIAINQFDLIYTAAVLMAKGVKLTFQALEGIGQAVVSLGTGDLSGFASAIKGIGTNSIDAAKSIGQELKGLANRNASDMADIASHASGKYAFQFALAAGDAGRMFAKASAEQHKLIEDAGLKLVNSYLVGVSHGKEMSASLWHSMSDDARASFTQTAQTGIDQFNQELISRLNNVANNAGKGAKKVSDQMAKAQAEWLKEQLAGVNDWLKALGSQVQISEGVWNKLLAPDTKGALVKASDAFHAIQDVIQKGQAQLLAEQMKGVAGQSQIINVLSEDYKRMGPELDAVAAKYGVLLHVIEQLHPPMTEHIADMNIVTASEKQVEAQTAGWIATLDKVTPSLLSVAQASVKAAHDTQAEWAANTQTLFEFGKQMGYTGDALTKFAHDGIASVQGFGAAGEKAFSDFMKAQAQVSFDALSKKVNAAVNGIVEIFTLIPGKFGDMAKEIQKVVNTIDKILGNLHKIFASIPENLGGVLATVINLFRNTTGSIADMGTTAQSTATATEGLNGTLDDMQKAAKNAAQGVGQWGDAVGTGMQGVVKQVQSGAAQVIGAAAAMMAGIGLVITGHATGGGVGAIEGALGGALTGLAIGSNPALLAATWGASAPIGAIIGGLVGLFAGLFGGGKSAAQKAQEQAAADSAKINMQQAAQQVINSAIQGFDAALAFFNNLDEFTAPRKAKFQEFWKAMQRLMDGFVTLAKAFSVESLAQAKVAAEAITPIAQAISALPAAFNAISGHFGVAESSFDIFFRDFDSLMNRFFARADVWIEGQAKRAFKVADRLTPVVNLISPLVQGFKDLGSLTAPSDAMFDILDAALNTLVTRMDALSGKWDKALLKSIANFAEKVSPSVDLWKNTADALRSMVDVPLPTSQDFSNLFTGIESAITGTLDLSSRISTEGMAKAEAIAVSSLAIFTAIKAAVESLGALRDYKAVGSETFKLLLSDFNQALQLMLDMDALSERFITLAKIFEDNIKAGADHLANAISIFTTAIRNLGFALGAFGVTVTVPGEVGTTAASGGVGATSASSSGGGFAPSSFFGSGSGFAPAFASSGSSGNVYFERGAIQINGSLIHQDEVEDVVMRAVVKSQRRGKL